jgi:putative DNA methylase
MIEIPPKFAGKAPVNPRTRNSRDAWSRQWVGADGLADDMRYYGEWMREEALSRIGTLYPKVEISAAMATDRPDLKAYVGQKLTVIAWLWARTVRSPNPAFAHVDIPLASTFMLSKMKGNEAYVEPMIAENSYRFEVKSGLPANLDSAKSGTTAGKRSAFRCLMSGVPVGYDHIRTEGKAGRMGTRLMAIVAEGNRGRVYLTPTAEQEELALTAKPSWKPETILPDNPRDFKTPNYGLKTYGDLFTNRQLVALNTFSDLVGEARERVLADTLSITTTTEGDTQLDNIDSAKAYADAVSVYLALAVSSLSDRMSTICTWDAGGPTWGTKTRNTFARQAIPMSWDFAEVNPLSSQSGSLANSIDYTAKGISVSGKAGIAVQQDASSQNISSGKVISTDPPYYDNIGYADLSDFFYVWLRPSLKPVFPDLFATLGSPKAAELVATPYRHGGKEPAEKFFLDGMTQAMHRLAEQANPTFPVTIYYAFKQSETQSVEGTASTGWETFLDAVIRAGFAISGTWPMRTELSNRMIGSGTNALASSIVLVCRQRAQTAETVSRRVFQRELNRVLPEALDEMTRGSGEDRSPVAPVDLSQSIIGPGMAVFSRYAAVLEADGTPMTVLTALQLINRFLADDDFDHDTQFCLQWFEQFGWREGRFGDADTLARAKGTSVEGVRQSGVLYAAAGIVRLLKWADYSESWNPADDTRLPVWEILHHLIRVFKADGESGAGKILAAVASKSEPTRQLAYRLYTLCERAGWAEDARAYNEVITSWSAIEDAAASSPEPRQTTLFDR